MNLLVFILIQHPYYENEAVVESALFLTPITNNVLFAQTDTNLPDVFEFDTTLGVYNTRDDLVVDVMGMFVARVADIFVNTLQLFFAQ
jgi:hypothetical protein